jgi:hypothetical protein
MFAARRWAPGILVAVATLIAAAAAWAEAGWSDYVNARFQYRICYPTAVFTPEPEAENSDGRRFSAGGGVSLIVYGRNNALDQAIKTVAADTGARLAGEGGKVTYSALRPNLFAVSGTHAGQIFYAKGLLKDNQYKIFELTYPAAQASHLNAIVQKIAGCFSNTER